MAMNYGSYSPEEARQIWEKRLVKTASVERDKRLARNLTMYRGLPATVDTDTVTTVVGSGGNSTIAAKITAKGAAPETTDIKAGEEDFKQYQISLGFYVNGREMMQDPSVKNAKVDWCYRNIGRLEDYIWVNGDSTINLSGMVTQARANPNGKITASDASGADVDNVGAWAGTDSDIDIQKDVLEALSRIGDDYANSPMFLVGRRADLKYIRQLDDLRNSYADQILDLFGAGSVNDFLRTSSYIPTGYVYIVAKDAEVAEFTVSTEMMVDNDYPREKGDNYWTEVREWINPFQCYDAEGFVEIQIT